VTLDHETNPVLEVVVRVDDAAVGETPDDAAELAITVTDVNEAPQVALVETVTTLAENAEVAAARKVADVVITDDETGENVLSLAGADAEMFVIDGSELYLKANVTLDHETNPVLEVVVRVDDAAVGETPDDAAELAITVTDVNEAPQVALVETVTTLAENAEVAAARRVADIVITDDEAGENVMSLAGADAEMFVIDSGSLYLKANVTLDHETNPVLEVVVRVDDATVGETPDDAAELAITVTDVNEDEDADGVNSEVENGAPSGGDGNGDGIPDRQQPNVASLPNSVDGTYVTLAAPEATILQNARAVSDPPAGSSPENADFPLGFFHYELTGIDEGASVVITIYCETTETLNTYLKYGATPDDPTPHWYAFMYDEEDKTGAKIFADRIEVYLVDGERGDDDLTVNGVIVDPGAPIRNEYPWQNPVLPGDVDNNGQVQPLDVLKLINEINDGGIRQLETATATTHVFFPFWDVSGNNVLSPEDVLRTISFLNAETLSGQGESEAAGAGLTAPRGEGEAAGPDAGLEPANSTGESRVDLPGLRPTVPAPPLSAPAADQFFGWLGRREAERAPAEGRAFSGPPAEAKLSESETHLRRINPADFEGRLTRRTGKSVDEELLAELDRPCLEGLRGLAD
jgi:hypothetical protein